MKFKYNAVIAAAIALGLAAPLAAHADTFSFSPTGNGANLVSVSTIDQAPGDALAVGGVTAIQAAANGAANTNFQLYYQANLNSFLAPDGGNAFSNGSTVPGGFSKLYFTFTAGFGENVKSFTVGSDGSQTATFGLSNDQSSNYFRIYASSQLGNNTTGTGFNTGTLILSGRITSEPSSNFTVPGGQTTLGALDQYSATPNNYPGVTSVTGTGSTEIRVTVDSFLQGYFPTLRVGSVISDFITSGNSPFNKVDPMSCITAGAVCLTPNVGTVNGRTGPDFLLEADASQTLISVAAPVARVPEPGTTALLGLGLAFLGLFGVARKKNKA